MKWKELSQSIKVLELQGSIDPEVEIKDIIHHSNRVKENGIFVAIPGAKTDGHKYIESAKNYGALFAIVERFMPVNIPQVKVENSRIALAQLASHYYNYPSKKMKLIGITATNGKTTTSFMLYEILQKAGLKVGIIGTVEIKYGNTIIPSDLTTPESIDLQRYLFEMHKDGVEIAIMEVSSSAQELYRNYGIDYDIVSFHNISEEHIEQHGSYEKYFAYKSRLVREASQNTAVLLNTDFDELTALGLETPGQVFTLSSKDSTKSDIFIEDLDLSTGMGKFNLYFKEKKQGNWSLNEGHLSLKLGVAGYSSVLNSMVAVGICKLLKIEDEFIVSGLEDFKGVERRFEMIFDHEFKILDDHFANQKNIEITMNTLKKMKYKDLHIIYAIRGNRGKDLNYNNALELLKWSKALKPKNIIVCKSSDCTGEKDLVSMDEEKSCKRAFMEENMEYNLRENLQDSIVEILPKINEGDILLLAGCQGMDQGARFVWDYLLINGNDKYKEELLDKISKRVC